ncbi:hypothetical protein OBBRIDRAFT_818795 [Obba rivulosa]|uniref:Dystroglycan-type cadherin-like domain-containing protein n=1 Tax=Obba rivulosa TaxID=1052685 RepID=A0A8E2B377_9APHY|nr:hypothetical protein OBBRIDRAFT_818795 [Obba rivulosa]
MLVTLFTFLAAAASACASSVSVNFPLDQQLPLVARTNVLYSWTFSQATFASSNNASLLYTLDGPSWLTLDGPTRTLLGSPTSDDEGEPSVTIMAKDPNSDASSSSRMKLYVTSDPPPMLNISVTQQFRQHNPSLSSVFLLSTGSALDQPNPSLRVPPKWSFSIGFEYNTFVLGEGDDGDGDVYYGALLTNGSSLPPWVRFDPDAITFDGVTPQIYNGVPQTLSVALHASDRAGFSAASVPFDIVVTAHELSLSEPSLPTINVTVDTPFNISLTSPADFSGVLVDDEPVQPSDIAGLAIDTSQYRDWLSYDSNSRTLSGTPPSELDGHQTVLLPVTLTSVVNQSLQTNVSLAVVPSYFTTATLQPVLASPGKFFQYDLTQYFSNKTALGNQDEISVSAAFDPDDTSTYLTFNTTSAVLSGWVPVKVNNTHVTVTFTAYSHFTHSTSHTSLPMSLSVSDFTKGSSTSSGLSAAARAKMLLGLKIAFGIVSGLVVLGMSLAAFRRWARLPDTALDGEAGQRAWTADEMKWYGIGADGDVVDEKYSGPALEEGYGWADRAATVRKEKEVDARSPETQVESKYGALGLQHVLTRTPSASNTDTPASPGVMRKAEFLSALRATARKVSDKYRTVSDKYRRGASAPRRPPIGKPVLIMASDQRVSGFISGAGARAATSAAASELPFPNGPLPPLPPTKTRIEVLPFEDAPVAIGQYTPSALASIVDSPSSSTGSRSIPRRRADFAPPRPRSLKTPPQAHLQDTHAYAERPASVESAASAADSLGSSASAREAVVQTATRATSVRSARSTLSVGAAEQLEPGVRPRLVPFTSASRVPVPKVPSGLGAGAASEGGKAGDGKAAASPGAGAGRTRVQSQSAKVFRNQDRDAGDGDGAGSGEDLRESIEYRGSVDAVPPVPRMLARTGEQFRFRVSVSPSARGAPAGAGSPKNTAALEARLVSGGALPRYMKVDLDAAGSGRRVVELWGTPGARDVGEVNVGIYECEGGVCVGRAVVEVVTRS